MGKVKTTRFGFQVDLDIETVKKNMDNYIAMFGQTRYEMHADGVKEIVECPFCEVPCLNEWCVYTPKEDK